MDDPEAGYFRGRGATFNPENRFESARLEPISVDDPEHDSRKGPKTEFFRDHSRTIVTRNDSPDIPFNVSVNPYRGCEHGCIYCYARPTHDYLGLSAGLDFESKVFVKERAPELLREKLLSPSWKPEILSFSGVTDPYQPVEKKLRVTRRCLEVLLEFRNPFTVISKNHLLTRDIDILSEMSKIRAAAAFVSVTTLDGSLSAVLEPRASRPEFRLEAIRELSEAGIPVGAMIAPVIPGLTDTEIPAILAAVAKAGAKFAGFVPLRLPLAVGPLFEEWVKTHFPDRENKILNRQRSIRGGKLNDPRFGSRMEGSGPFSEQIRGLFDLHCRKHGLNAEELKLTTEHFRRPGEQMVLF